MAEELKTEGQIIADQKGNDTTVTISQEKLDSLINEKFKKGAEKANAQLMESLGVQSIDEIKNIIEAKKQAEEAQKTELQKAMEAVEAANREKEAILKEAEELRKKNSIQGLAVEHGIKELDYFELELNKRSGEDGFDKEKFIESLRVEKPFIFGSDAPKPKVITDTTGNGSDKPGDLASQLEGLSLNELKKLQSKL